MKLDLGRPGGRAPLDLAKEKLLRHQISIRLQKPVLTVLLTLQIEMSAQTTNDMLLTHIHTPELTWY